MGQDKGPATNYTLVFGSNNLIGLGGAVVTVAQKDGTKAQLLSIDRDLERGGDGKLLASFEVRNQAGTLLTKIRRNKPVHVDASLSCTEGPDFAEVSGPHGLVASVRVRDHNTIEVNGDFYVGGLRIQALPTGTHMGGLTLEGNTFQGLGDAIHFGY